MKQIDLNNAERTFQDEPSPEVVYADQNIAIISSVKDFQKTDETFLVNSFIMVTVKQGHATLKVDNDIFEIKAGDAFVCTPRNIIDSAMISVDFDMFGLIISPKFGQQITRDTGLDVAAFNISALHKIIHMTEEEIDIILKYGSLLAHVCLKEPTLSRNRALHHLLQASAFEFFDIINKEHCANPNINNYSAAEQTFARFLEMLHNDETPIHTVNEYAERLHITSKYFSAICKQVAGRTASDIINEEIVNSARILLRDPRNSIKMVADKLNFANQSHFGTFIRRHTGMSPQQLRETL